MDLARRNVDGLARAQGHRVHEEGDDDARVARVLLPQDAHELVGARRRGRAGREAGAARGHELFDALGGRRGVLVEEPRGQGTQAPTHGGQLEAVTQAVRELALQADEELAGLARHAEAHERAELGERVDHLGLVVHVPVDAARVRALDAQDLLAQVALARDLLRRMHLEAQGLGGGDDLRQVRQGRAKRVEQASAESSLGVLADVLGEGLPARQQRRSVRVGAEPHLGHRVVPGGGPQELGDRVRGAPRVSFRPADQSFHRSNPIGIGGVNT